MEDSGINFLVCNPFAAIYVMIFIVLAVAIAAKCLIGHLQWKSKPNRRITQRFWMCISAAASRLFKWLRSVLRVLASPFRRVWTDVVRLVEERGKSRQARRSRT